MSSFRGEIEGFVEEVRRFESVLQARLDGSHFSELTAIALEDFEGEEDVESKIDDVLAPIDAALGFLSEDLAALGRLRETLERRLEDHLYSSEVPTLTPNYFGDWKELSEKLVEPSQNSGVKMNIRVSIVRGISCHPVVASEEDIKRLEARVLAAKPKDSMNYAFVVGRNWAIDRVRRNRFAAVKLRQEAEKQAAEARERAREQKAREEFLALMPTVLSSASAARKASVEIVRLRVFEGVVEPDVARHFPGTTRAQRYKWLQRGRKLFAEIGGAELRETLALRLTSPESSTPYQDR